MIRSNPKLPCFTSKVPPSQVILTIFLCLAVFYGLAKLVAIPLRIDDFDSFRPIRTEDVQSPGQGFGKSEIDP
ncbi:uncharacterized protein LOC27208724 [Drosophila simulans]|uniref:Uncharacterized protein n=1 Tax=Drosophila simulans TaxID=7240 RepID=A0A0J9QZ14_DROSI|nr:uncharacterized protein LOC27208724 [Drosophila simulans]XP_044779868.1 uncharacterized protein LOC27208724 [Drosophila simulans]XP_044779869.1 uncharacterized protein LOC27208724 [Drosophila simulans]XP_044779870.1 uncharacterized protein LOC27208724 [Drosophila simulans]XP_044779871.1 uncharacterized protein LOC27208724 [Drosophila simulans]KMY89183.1 uncharacterized protein Dsimw501_GD28881 [Drosophila simulans]